MEYTRRKYKKKEAVVVEEEEGGGGGGGEEEEASRSGTEANACRKDDGRDVEHLPRTECTITLRR